MNLGNRLGIYKSNMEDVLEDHSESSDDDASLSASSDDDERIKRKVDNYVLWSFFIINVYHFSLNNM